MPVSEQIISKCMSIVTMKRDTNSTDFYDRVDKAIEEIKIAYNSKNLNTSLASQVDFSHLSYRCAYLHRYFTCIVILNRRMWGRFYAGNNEVRRFLELKFNSSMKSINVCSLGGGPGTDIMAFYLFLKMNGMSKMNINGVLFDKYTEWDDIFQSLVSLFAVNSFVRYEYFNFFEVNPNLNVLNKIKNADVVSIVKFISAVGYERLSTQTRIQNLLKAVKKGALVIFVDNTDSSYSDLMENAADAANLRLLEKVIRKKSRVPAGERKLMELYKNVFVCEPQKNAIVTACIWIKE